MTHWLFSALFCGLFGLEMAQMFAALHLRGPSDWSGVLLLLVAAVSTLVSLSRRLPGQNVLLAAAVIALLGSMAQIISALAGFPFGPFRLAKATGPRVFGVLPWFVPWVWILVILNARGVAQLILRFRRDDKSYGFRLLGLTTLLGVFLVLGLELFASQGTSHSLWRPTRLAVTWHEDSMTGFLVLVLTVVIILAFATPALINKRPARLSPDWHPLLIWTLLNLLFAVAAFRASLLSAALPGAGIALITILLAWRGVKPGLARISNGR